MKACSKCKDEKPLTEYYLFNRSKDGHQHICKQCMKVAYNKCRTEKREHYHKVQKTREQQNYDRLMEWKATQQCIKCGNNNPIVLDLHHRDPAQKDIEVSNAVRKWSWDKLVVEIEKCNVLCANCHRIEHYTLRQK